MSTLQYRIVVLAFGLVAIQREAAAQYAVSPGSRARVVNVANGTPVVAGLLVRTAGDTVVIADASGAYVPSFVGPERRLEVSAGIKRKTTRGMAAGAVVGVVVGAIAGATAYKEYESDVACDEPDCLDPGSAGAAYVGALVVGAVGALVGTVVGSLMTYEQWRPIERVGISTSLGIDRRGRFAVSLTF